MLRTAQDSGDFTEMRSALIKLSRSSNPGNRNEMEQEEAEVAEVRWIVSQLESHGASSFQWLAVLL